MADKSADKLKRRADHQIVRCSSFGDLLYACRTCAVSFAPISRYINSSCQSGKAVEIKKKKGKAVYQGSSIGCCRYVCHMEKRPPGDNSGTATFYTFTIDWCSWMNLYSICYAITYLARVCDDDDLFKPIRTINVHICIAAVVAYSMLWIHLNETHIMLPNTNRRTRSKPDQAIIARK